LNQAEEDALPQLTQREREVWDLYTGKQMRTTKIAEELGISFQRVSAIVAQCRAKMPPVDRTEMRRRLIDLKEDVIERALSLAALEGAPVVAGKDGDIVRDPVDQSVVRDHSGRMQALKLALEASRELRRLEGLDAATKTETSATVRYVLEGVNTDDLT
jgi:DNA-binding CsgD family transcriptional regulator